MFVLLCRSDGIGGKQLTVEGRFLGEMRRRGVRNDYLVTREV